jgi:hypothetical protein
MSDGEAVDGSGLEAPWGHKSSYGSPLKFPYRPLAVSFRASVTNNSTANVRIIMLALNPTAA